MHYTKDFDTWNRRKQIIQNTSIPPGYKEREVWWAQLGVNVGDEEDGKGRYFSRPALIIKGFSKNLVWIVPLTTAPRSGKFYYRFVLNERLSVAILTQMRVLDVRRFTKRIGTVDEPSFEELKQRLQSLFL